MPEIQDYIESSVWRNIHKAHVDKFFIDVLKSDERTKRYFVEEITMEPSQRVQTKAKISSIAGLAVRIVAGIGWTSKAIPIVGTLFKSCPIALGLFANHKSYMKGAWLFKNPFNQDRLNVNGKELEIRDWSIWISSTRKGLFDSSLTEVKTICEKDSAQPYCGKIPGILSIRSDEELKKDLLNFFQKARNIMHGEYIGRTQFEVEYQRSEDSNLGLVEFGFKNSPSDWKDAVKQGLSPESLVVSLFHLCNRITSHLKEDFEKLESK